MSPETIVISRGNFVSIIYYEDYTPYGIPSFSRDFYCSESEEPLCLELSRNYFFSNIFDSFFFSKLLFYFCLLHREKMAFFTRPTISVPILPPSEQVACNATKTSSSGQASHDSCSLTSTTSCIVTGETKVNVTTNAKLAVSTSSLSSLATSSSTDSAESQRYEYTIETFGVQV